MNLKFLLLKKHLFIRARGKKIEIPDSTCEKVDIQMNQSKFFETEFEDIEYCDAYDMEAALRSLPSYIEKEDSFLQIRGKQVRCAESPKHNQKEEILFEHGQVEEIFAINRSDDIKQSSRCVKCDGKRSLKLLHR